MSSHYIHARHRATGDIVRVVCVGDRYLVDDDFMREVEFNKWYEVCDEKRRNNT